jgi:hypothetical protein
MIYEEPLDSLQQQRIGDLHEGKRIGGNLAAQAGIISDKTYWPKPIEAQYNVPMATDPEAARAYLKTALAELGVNMKPASELAGKNHAYIQQYITLGKPLWLPEAVRDALVLAYGLDAERLRPPTALLRSSRSVTGRRHERQIDAKGFGKFVDDPRKLELLDLYDAIAPQTRQLALVVLRGLATYSIPNAA